MRQVTRALGTALLVSGMLGSTHGAQAQQSEQETMSFFVTSAGPGDGANLGGLDGADAYCETLAEAAGVTGEVWQAYLSALESGDQPTVNARDRIGTGPWHNADGDLIAENVADLHGDDERDRNSINKEFALDESGEPVNGRGDEPNRHDILTGSDSHGQAVGDDPATSTCDNWTSNGEGSAMLGHHDRSGGGNSSWNSAHASRGCGQEDLEGTGGAGLFYCFAT